MSIYQIVGAIWLINTIVIIVVMTEMDSSSKNSLFITGFINKHRVTFTICYFISIVLAILLLRITIE
jgi:hypothetical protein